MNAALCLPLKACEVLGFMKSVLRRNYLLSKNVFGNILEFVFGYFQQNPYRTCKTPKHFSLAWKYVFIQKYVAIGDANEPAFRFTEKKPSSRLLSNDSIGKVVFDKWIFPYSVTLRRISLIFSVRLKSAPSIKKTELQQAKQ